MTPTEYRDQLVEKVNAVQLQRDIAALEGALGVASLQTVMEETGAGYLTAADIRRETGFGETRFGAFASLPDDYQDGRCRPLYETEADLQELRGLGRWLASADETALCILANLRNYIIGEGFTYTAAPRLKGDAAELVAEVQAFVDEFLDVNDWVDEHESAILDAAVTDGELLLWLRGCGRGAPRVESWSGEHLTEPSNAREIEDYLGMPGLEWRFGVASDQGRPERVHGYLLDPYGKGEWEFAPESEAVFIKRNVRRQCKRGVSDFAVPFKAMTRGAKLVEHTVLGGAIQASIAFVIKAAAGTSGASLGGLLNQSPAVGQFKAIGPNGRTGTYQSEQYMGGKVIRTNGHDYQAGPMGSPQGPVYLDILQGVYRRVGSRWCMPEYMVSGDASNANYSSTLVASSPFVKNAINEQSALGRDFRRLLWKGIAMAASHGRFGGLTAAEIRQAVEIQVEAVSPEDRDPVQTEQVYDAQQRAGVLSPKTRAGKSGLDYDEERANGAKEAGPAPMFGEVAAGQTQVVQERLMDLKFSLLEGVER